FALPLPSRVAEPRTPSAFETVTVPVGVAPPPFAVTVTATMGEVPADVGCTVAVVVVPLRTTCTTSLVVLLFSLFAPVVSNRAVMLWLPTESDDVLNGATPFVVVAKPSDWLSSRNVTTEPSDTGPRFCSRVDVDVNVTDWPGSDGFC